MAGIVTDSEACLLVQAELVELAKGVGDDKTAVEDDASSAVYTEEIISLDLIPAPDNHGSVSLFIRLTGRGSLINSIPGAI